MDLAQSTDAAAILRQWEEEHTQSGYDPVPVLTRLAELIEQETENYQKMDPDPFDERHPSRADPECKLGQMLKTLFRKDLFMTKLVNDYLRDNYWSRVRVPDQDIDALNIAACRLLLDTMPGLETSAVFQPDNDSLINRMLKWAQTAQDPLRSYATGLLAAAMEVQEVATKYREQNGKLIPLMLKRLWEIQSTINGNKENGENVQCNGDIQNGTHDGGTVAEGTTDEGAGIDVAASNLDRPFAHLSKFQKQQNLSNQLDNERIKNTPYGSRNKSRYSENGIYGSMKSPAITYSPDKSLNTSKTPSKFDNNQILHEEPDRKRARIDLNNSIQSPPNNSSFNSQKSPGGQQNHAQHNLDVTDSSNSSWAELENYVIGYIQMYPPTASTKQILILKYLTPMGEYQEFLSHAFEQNALGLILSYVNVKEHGDVRLAFEALKYLSALLCHKKFSIEFIHAGGLQRLLEVPRPSVAATGVSICLYYLAYCQDAMEKVCLLSEYVIWHLVKYALWLIECSHHDSSRCHAVMFFGLTFSFKVILDAFDDQDGLRKLYNVISTLPILSTDDDHLLLNDDVVCAARQIVRHVCVALKRYLEAHLYVRSEQLKRSVVQLLPYKAMCKLNSAEDVQERIDTMLELLPYRAHWPPVDELLRLGAITILLQIIAFSYEWNFGGRAETVKSALDVLAICAIMPRVQMLFGERVDLPEEAITVGINIILGAAEGEIVADPDVQKAALSVIVNCVCAPIHRPGGSVTRFSMGIGSPRKKSNLRNSEELIQKVWESVRSQSGIMVLLQLMQVKTPITDADSIRTLACRALAGLARSDTVKQIIGKLPLFTNGQLQNLMRTPILQEKRQEHVLFQKYALELMEKVSGNTKHTASHEIDASLANIHRANVVAQTKIQFNDKQLLQLIHQHLVGRGLNETAGTLQREAQLNAILPPPGTINVPTPSIAKNLSIAGNNFSPLRYVPPTTPRSRIPYLHHHKNTANTSISNSISTTSTSTQNHSTTPTTEASQLQSTLTSSIKIIRKTNNSSTSANNQSTTSTPQNSRLEKQISCTGDTFSGTTTIAIPGTSTDETIVPPRITLDSIITEYLTNQHALCKNPMATCPQFNLFVPHKCPDPKPHIASMHNVVLRHSKRAMGYNSRTLDRRLIHSRFCPVQTIRVVDSFYTCAQFMPNNDTKMIVGSFNGEVKLFNIQTGNEEATYQCHDSLINNIQISRTGKLLLTSTSWRSPLSALWDTEYFEMKCPLDEEEYVEFSNLTQDKIIGTRGEIATIYDVATGTKLFSLSPTISNQYTKNKATFSPTDELILSDGVLWDAVSNQQIHKFDKLNQTQSGVFHPNGLEVVSNTEVWDLRTFHLLRTVPTLNQSQVLFTNLGDIIYGVALEHEAEEEIEYDTSFKTLDASDYSSIATIDVKKNIFSLCINKYDTQIALVENQGVFESGQESVVRIYDVGRRRDDEDEQEEDDDDDMDNSEDGSGSGSESEENSINLLIDAVAAASSRRRRRRRNSRRRTSGGGGGGNGAAEGGLRGAPAANDNENNIAGENENNAGNDNQNENNEEQNEENNDDDNEDDDDDDDDDGEWQSLSSNDDYDDDGGAFSMSDTSDMDALEDLLFE